MIKRHNEKQEGNVKQWQRQWWRSSSSWQTIKFTLETMNFFTSFENGKKNMRKTVWKKEAAHLWLKYKQMKCLFGLWLCVRVTWYIVLWLPTISLSDDIHFIFMYLYININIQECLHYTRIIHDDMWWLLGTVGYKIYTHERKSVQLKKNVTKILMNKWLTKWRRQ